MLHAKLPSPPLVNFRLDTSENSNRNLCPYVISFSKCSAHAQSSHCSYASVLIVADNVPAVHFLDQPGSR